MYTEAYHMCTAPLARRKLPFFMQLRSSCLFTCVQYDRQRTLAGQTQWAGPAAHVTTPSWLTSRVCKACVKRVRVVKQERLCYVCWQPL